MPSINGILAGVCGVLLLVILGLGIWLYIDDLKIQKAKAEKIVLVTANDAYKVATQQQNDAVEKLKQDTKRMTDDAARAVADAELQNKALAAQVIVLTRTPLKGDACKAADKLFNFYLGSHK
jgi:hypothetical protein